MSAGTTPINDAVVNSLLLTKKLLLTEQKLPKNKRNLSYHIQKKTSYLATAKFYRSIWKI